MYNTVGDGRLGYPEEGPFDAIHVGAASPSLPHAVRNIAYERNS